MATSHTQSVPAIYEGGVLRPLQPLALPEHARVQITVVLEAKPPTPDREQIRAALTAAGLSLVEPPSGTRLEPLSPEARAALARQVPPGRPLSTIIAEEREGR